jgi:hypothetical protein
MSDLATSPLQGGKPEVDADDKDITPFNISVTTLHDEKIQIQSTVHDHFRMVNGMVCSRTEMIVQRV